MIILSTDTEVDRRYYECLEPYLARAYHLNYDEEQRATAAEEGYFWTNEQQSGHTNAQRERQISARVAGRF